MNIQWTVSELFHTGIMRSVLVLAKAHNKLLYTLKQTEAARVAKLPDCRIRFWRCGRSYIDGHLSLINNSTSETSNCTWEAAPTPPGHAIPVFIVLQKRKWGRCMSGSKIPPRTRKRGMWRDVLHSSVLPKPVEPNYNQSKFGKFTECSSTCSVSSRSAVLSSARNSFPLNTPSSEENKTKRIKCYEIQRSFCIYLFW
jgi:hypothetical protein